MQMWRVAVVVVLTHSADLIAAAHHIAALYVSLLEMGVLAPDGLSPGQQVLNQDDLAPVSEGTRRHHPPMGHGIHWIAHSHVIFPPILAVGCAPAPAR